MYRYLYYFSRILLSHEYKLKKKKEEKKQEVINIS